VWAVYPVEFGHGWAFCLYYTCANIIAEEYSSIGLQATVLGMTSSSLQLGQLLATMGMGVLVDRVGMRSSFAICAAVLGVGASPLLVELPACALWTAGCVARVPATGAALARRLARGSARLAARLSGRSRDRAPLRPAGLPSSTDMTSDVGGIGMDIPVVPLPEDRAAD
jgi:MFS family permease